MRGIEVNYFANREHPNRQQIHFWFLELRTPELLIKLAAVHGTPTKKLILKRPLLKLAEREKNWIWLRYFLRKNGWNGTRTDNRGRYRGQPLPTALCKQCDCKAPPFKLLLFPPKRSICRRGTVGARAIQPAASWARTWRFNSEVQLVMIRWIKQEWQTCSRFGPMPTIEALRNRISDGLGKWPENDLDNASEVVVNPEQSKDCSYCSGAL